MLGMDFVGFLCLMITSFKLASHHEVFIDILESGTVISLNTSTKYSCWIFYEIIKYKNLQNPFLLIHAVIKYYIY